MRAEAERLNEKAAAAAERRGGAQTELALARDAVGSHESTAAEAMGRLEVLRRDDVWSVVADEPSPPTNLVEVAVAVAGAAADASTEADDNALQRAYRQLLDELGRGYDPGLSYVDHVAVVEVTSDTGTSRCCGWPRSSAIRSSASAICCPSATARSSSATC